MADTEEPKKPTQTKKAMMQGPTAPSSSQPQAAPSGLGPSKDSIKINSGLEKITQKLEEIKTADKEQRADIKDALANLGSTVEESAPDKSTKEEQSEKKQRLSKAFEKLGATFKKAFGGLSGLGKLLSGALGPLKYFWDAVKKVKGFILAFLAVFLLKNFTIKDVKAMWKGMKEFFLETKKLFIAIMEFMKPIITWFREDFVPATFTLFTESITNLTKLFEDLTRDFNGFTEKGWKEKMLTIITAIGSLGTFVTNFFAGVVDWAFRLMGYDGSITTDFRNWLNGVFGPDLMDSLTTIFTTIIGAMAIARVFGMSPITFIKITSTMIWGSIRLLFALVRLAMSPIGLGIGLAALTAYYHEEIFKGIDQAMGSVANWFSNLPSIINNMLVGTSFGDWLGLKKKDIIEYDHDKDIKDKHELQKKRIELAKAELKRLEHWKFQSQAGGDQADATRREGRLFDSSEGNWLGFGKSKDMFDMQRARAELRNAVAIEKGWKEWYKLDETVPDKPGGVTMKEPPSSETGMGDVINKSLLKTPEYGKERDMTEQFEGFGKKGRPGFSYDDGRGNITIGYGFNMDKDNAESIMKNAGIDKNWNDLYAGKIALTKEEGRRLKSFEMGYFRDSAKNWIGADKWGKMNVGAQNALTDMAYNMGGQFTGKHSDGSFKWKDLRSALRSEDTSGIGTHISGSNYAEQVGEGRSGYNISALEVAYAKPTTRPDLIPNPKWKESQDKMMAQTLNVNNVEGDNIQYAGQGFRDKGNGRSLVADALVV